METKKHASKDLHAQRKSFFLIGLSISLTLVIMAFEWTSAKRTVIDKRFNLPVINEMTLINEVKSYNPTTPPEIKKELSRLEKKTAEPMVFIESKEAPENESKFTLDPPDLPESLGNLVFVDKPEETDSIFLFPESQAEPQGGFKTFYETLAKNIHYPKQASRIGTEGKVFVQFVIDKSGTPTDFKISRGIGAGCDEEAIRVIALTKWVPAKQRGRPIRVRMTLPVVFQLSH